MNYLFENVFYKKSEGKSADELMNISYWLILSAKNILKWLYAVYLLKDSNNYLLVILLCIFPLIKFVVIGLGNIYKFNKITKHWVLIALMTIIVLWESFFELPSHLFFPKNYIYLHTNFFKIYDLAKYRNVQIGSELIENFMILVFLYFTFKSGVIGLVSILTLTFSLAVLIYYILAEFYFMFIANEKVINPNEVDDYGRQFRKSLREKKELERNMKINLKRVNKSRDDYDNNYESSESESKEVEVMDGSKREVEHNNPLSNHKYLQTEKSSDNLNN